MGKTPHATVDVATHTELQWNYPGLRVLLAATVGIAFSPGPVVFGCLGLFAPYFQSDYGWTRGQFMLGLTAFNLAGMMAAPLTGRLLDRFGTRALLLPAVVALAGGFVVEAYLAATQASFYAIAFVWGLLTVSAQGIGYNKVLTTWFVRHRGLAIGIATAGIGVGYVIAPQLALALLAHLPWRDALACMGIAVIAVTWTVAFLFLHANPKPPKDVEASPGSTIRAAARSPEFVLILSGVFLASLAMSGLVPQIAFIARDSNLSATLVGTVTTAYGLSSITGRFVCGWLCDRLSVNRVAASMFAAAAAALLLASLIHPAGGLMPILVLYVVMGFCFGSESDLIPLLVSRYFGQRHFGAVYGMLFSGFLAGTSLGAALMGYGRDYFGSYAIPELIASAVLVVATGLMLALRTRKADGSRTTLDVSTS